MEPAFSYLQNKPLPNNTQGFVNKYELKYHIVFFTIQWLFSQCSELQQFVSLQYHVSQELLLIKSMLLKV